MLEQRIPFESFEHTLAHLVGGLDVERDARDGADRAEPHDQPVEVGVAARESHDLAPGVAGAPAPATEM